MLSRRIFTPSSHIFLLAKKRLWPRIWCHWRELCKIFLIPLVLVAGLLSIRNWCTLACFRRRSYVTFNFPGFLPFFFEEENNKWPKRECSICPASLAVAKRKQPQIQVSNRLHMCVVCRNFICCKRRIT